MKLQVGIYVVNYWQHWAFLSVPFSYLASFIWASKHTMQLEEQFGFQFLTLIAIWYSPIHGLQMPHYDILDSQIRFNIKLVQVLPQCMPSSM
mgnify:CR=1 FL=1